MLVRAGSVMTHGDLLVGQGRLHGREVVPLERPRRGGRIDRGTRRSRPADTVRPSGPRTTKVSSTVPW